MKIRFFELFPLLFALDLILPFLFALPYKGYSHLTQVMSVLGNRLAPLNTIYNLWLVFLGTLTLIGSIQLYPALAPVSKSLAFLLSAVLIVYALGACIVSGIFSVEETKRLETVSAKIHGFGSAIGFMLLTLGPLFAGLLLFKNSRFPLGVFSIICFILAAVFFVLFVMADKPNSQGTRWAWEGLWQRLTLLFMYLPISFLCLSIK